jgi:hypothetical protein
MRISAKKCYQGLPFSSFAAWLLILKLTLDFPQEKPVLLRRGRHVQQAGCDRRRRSQRHHCAPVRV